MFFAEVYKFIQKDGCSRSKKKQFVYPKKTIDGFNFGQIREIVLHHKAAYERFYFTCKNL